MQANPVPSCHTTHASKVSKVEPSILPSFLFFGALERYPNNHRYLARLIEDRVEGRPHDWMWTEPPVVEWQERVRRAIPGVRLERWRSAFSREFQYRSKDAAAERRRRIRHDLEQARELMKTLGVEDAEELDREALKRRLDALIAEPPPEGFDQAVADEIAMNLERVRIIEQTPESDYEGTILLEVETDPFGVLFMGEYGFASCLSIRGSNVWSAVSNAIDVDKAIVWAKEGGGNVVGRRLIALTEQGVVSFRTYTNRHGLALDTMFEEFIEAYAEHCAAPLARRVSPGPLLSDHWYDDGAI